MSIHVCWADWILWCTGSTPGEVWVTFVGRMRMATVELDFWFIYFLNSFVSRDM